MTYTYQQSEIQFKLDKGAICPERAHMGDLGFDLFMSDDVVTIHPGEIKLVSTGVSCKFPDGWGALIKDRSSIASKRHVFTHAGVIDSGYRGEIKILFQNAGHQIQTFYAGDKIAQMVLVPVADVQVNVVDTFTEETSRNTGGFGSTGTNLQYQINLSD